MLHFINLAALPILGKKFVEKGTSAAADIDLAQLYSSGLVSRRLVQIGIAARGHGTEHGLPTDRLGAPVRSLQSIWEVSLYEMFFEINQTVMLLCGISVCLTFRTWGARLLTFTYCFASSEKTSNRLVTPGDICSAPNGTFVEYS